MDFIEGLPHSSTANCILVIVDMFTNFSHFIPIAHPYTTSSVATTFYKYGLQVSWVVNDYHL
jgi:hypothetical protein